MNQNRASQVSYDLDADDELFEASVLGMEEQKPHLGPFSKVLAFADQHISKICLATLTFFTTFMLLFLKFSKLDIKDNYIASVTVVLVELIKIIFCLCVSFLIEDRNTVISSIFSGGWNHLLKISFPALLYAIQNNLTHYSLARIEVPHFQTIYQARILLTAVFSVIILGRSYSRLKWVAMICLLLGVTFAQIDSYIYSDDVNGSKGKTKSIVGDDPLSGVKGIVSTLLGAAISGLAAVYSEKVLKESNSGSIWITNIQMCTVAMFFSSFMCYNDVETIYTKGLFFGFNYIVCLVILNQAIGGVLIAAVFFFSDSIAKAYAGAIALILISVLNEVIFEIPIHQLFVLGAVIVSLSSYYYSLPDDEPICCGKFNRRSPRF